MSSPHLPSPHVLAARRICQEARIVLTSLRCGPPHVARGDLRHDLMKLRQLMQYHLDVTLSTSGGVDEPLTTVVEADVEHVKEKDASVNTPVNLYNVPIINPARPFLQVVADPRAAGPHTLVALRAILRLLVHGDFAAFDVSLEGLAQGVLACKFEQTDAGADEAVEMAIADVLAMIFIQDTNAVLQDATLIEAFNTVFVTRNTFVHSPALCYHFEDVLTNMVSCVFQKRHRHPPSRALLILEYLINHLLHTPLVGGDALDEATREAKLAHDAIRILSLRLVRTALRTGWDNLSSLQNKTSCSESDTATCPLITLIQDDLCLSLLMTGQAIWTYNDSNAYISPGLVSLDVLSEISATISTLWNTLALRTFLITQFETIFTGFYTRALVLLRKRKLPINSLTFNANLIFDAEVEIILESLVDILCLHDHLRSIADGDGGCLETLFAYYDCHLRRSDVASGLMVELCRCCGGTVNEEGEAIVLNKSYSSNSIDDLASDLVAADGASVGISISQSRKELSASDAMMVQVEHPWRHVPAHLKELCAQALMGGMKCLFRDDHASAETLKKRAARKRSIMLRQVDGMEEDSGVDTSHVLRDIKSKKRLMRKAAHIFNSKASRGIEFLLDSGLVPDPVTPESVATFLRNGIVVGLNKQAVGAYLGEAGKAPVAGKSPPSWERDWFHKEVLQIYCSLFRFENQSLLDGLRMFLAAFRLPGEAQQIDRILQAFADSCSQVCEEGVNGSFKIFSDDPKRASDAAYLLSFSIIMLNTDRHNANIRDDRKMSCEDFVKNNTDYGRDITEKGKELPSAYLEGIYESIREEEIRTEAEGADGAMTVERWKDVLRSVDTPLVGLHPSVSDAEDLTELVLEHVWKPIISAIGALWGVSPDEDEHALSMTADSGQSGGMLGVQGARLGMDMAFEMLNGVRQLGRLDIFRKIFTWVCEYTGLLAEYSSDAIERTWLFTNSVEAQSAVVVALNTAIEHGEHLDEAGWKRVWAILFELRDLKLLHHHAVGKNKSLFVECDADLLTEMTRSHWNMCLMKNDMNFESIRKQKVKGKKTSSVFGAFGRAFFGVDTSVDDESFHGESDDIEVRARSCHGKEELVVWDECAMSDDEDYRIDDGSLPTDTLYSLNDGGFVSPGSKFENLLVRESIDMSRQLDMPITGLERVEETRRYQMSPRSRVRERMKNSINFIALVTDSRFLNNFAIIASMKALVDLLATASRPIISNLPPSACTKVERSDSVSSASSSTSFRGPFLQVPISPASEAFGEVLLCEIAVKNKDRLKILWSDVLQDHYLSSLTSMLVSPPAWASATKIPANPGLEKRVSGLIRLSLCSVSRDDIANDILSSWKFLLPSNDEQIATSPLGILDRHIGEGVWRIASQIDDLQRLSSEGWEGFMALLIWCAKRGGKLKPVRSSNIEGRSGLSQDDPAFLAYRSLHALLNANILVMTIPYSVIECLRWLLVAGKNRSCAQLSTASLDLLDLMLQKRIEVIAAGEVVSDEFWTICWRKVVEVVAEAAEMSSDAGVRQHSLSMLTDLFLDKNGTLVPSKILSRALVEVCVPLSERFIIELRTGKNVVSTDELLIEFELCIGLIFKPIRYHLQSFLDTGVGSDLSAIWKSVLSVLEDFLGNPGGSISSADQYAFIPFGLKATMDNLAIEHLQNAVKVLTAAGVLSSDLHPGNLAGMTLDLVKKMSFNENPTQVKIQSSKDVHATAVPESE